MARDDDEFYKMTLISYKAYTYTRHSGQVIAPPYRDTHRYRAIILYTNGKMAKINFNCHDVCWLELEP